MNRIILLDIDGVLVQPGGYRAALRATVKRFIGDYVIEEELPVSMEKRGISSEWDMSPLIIAAYWEDVLSRQPMENLSSLKKAPKSRCIWQKGFSWKDNKY